MLDTSDGDEETPSAGAEEEDGVDESEEAGDDADADTGAVDEEADEGGDDEIQDDDEDEDQPEGQSDSEVDEVAEEDDYDAYDDEDERGNGERMKDSLQRFAKEEAHIEEMKARMASLGSLILSDAEKHVSFTSRPSLPNTSLCRLWNSRNC